MLPLTVWQRPAGRLAGRYCAAIVRLDRPLGDRSIVDGVVARPERERAERRVSADADAVSDKRVGWHVELEVRTRDSDFSDRWLMLPEYVVDDDVEAVNWELGEEGHDEVCRANLRVHRRSATDARALGHQVIDAVAAGGSGVVSAVQCEVAVIRPAPERIEPAPSARSATDRSSYSGDPVGVAVRAALNSVCRLWRTSKGRLG